VEIIDLDDNIFEYIEPNMFMGLKNLKLLYLSSNLIQALHSDVIGVKLKLLA
jgi:hypothetical protein